MTDYELGNDIMHKLVDEMRGIASECEPTKPYIAMVLRDLAMDFGVLVNDLMDDVRMCPESDSHNFFDFRQAKWHRSKIPNKRDRE